MITFLDGRLVEKQPTRVVVDVHGVGYELLIPLSSYDRLPAPGERVKVLTYDHVREDAHLLFGFMTDGERQLFETMLGVSGIGPKLALGALSGLSVREIKSAVVEGDAKRLSSISGVGRKTAERLVIELRDKFSAAEALEATTGPDAVPGDQRLRDGVLALVSLGYKQAEAQKMLAQVAGQVSPEDSVEHIVRLALTR